VVVTQTNVTDQFIDVCLDEDTPKKPAKKMCGACFILTSLRFSTNSEYGRIVRAFRDVVLGTSGGQTLVSYYDDEDVQKELGALVATPARAPEAFRLLVESTPIALEFVRPHPTAFGAVCTRDDQTVFDSNLAERAVTFLASLERDVEAPRVRQALEFAIRLVEQSAGKRPGQILDILASIEPPTDTSGSMSRPSRSRDRRRGT
jgi:hypothetical protein